MQFLESNKIHYSNVFYHIGESRKLLFRFNNLIHINLINMLRFGKIVTHICNRLHKIEYSKNVVRKLVSVCQFQKRNSFDLYSSKRFRYVCDKCL